MLKYSAGILLYRFNNQILEFFLVHPGGPFGANKDLGLWSIPKGELKSGEDALEAAKREFKEETGTAIHGDFITLTPIRQKNNKIVFAFAIEGDLEVENIVSNYFEIEYPPKSGQKQLFPEIDKGEWFTIDKAKLKINEAQFDLILELKKILN